MDDLLESFGGEVPEEVAELHDKVRSLYHKKANGPLSLQLCCLIAVLAENSPSPTKPTKKAEKATV